MSFFFQTVCVFFFLNPLSRKCSILFVHVFVASFHLFELCHHHHFHYYYCCYFRTRQVCRRDPSQKSRFVRVLLSMLQSPSAAVSYEAAWTLVSLSGAPTAIRAVSCDKCDSSEARKGTKIVLTTFCLFCFDCAAFHEYTFLHKCVGLCVRSFGCREQAATTYAQLLNTQSDNNVKLIVLERLAGLKKHHAKVLQEVLMDILRALSSPNVDICRKTLEVAMDLVSPRNIEEVVQVRVAKDV